jgi:hypothetical protein
VARKYFTEDNRTVGYLVDQRDESPAGKERDGGG